MKAGKFIVRSTYCIFAIAEKTHVAIAAENINVNVIMPSQLSVILAADIAQRRLIVSGKAGLLSIGSAVSGDPCLHPRKSPSELLCEIIPTPVSDFAVWQLTPELYWMPSSHICTWRGPSRRMRFPSTSGFAVLLSNSDSCGGLSPSRHRAPTFFCSGSLCLCAASLLETQQLKLPSRDCCFPKSDKQRSNAFVFG